MRLQHRSFLYTAFAGLLAAGALFILASRARADVPNPVRIAVVFEQAGQPYTGPVRFTITCYGYSYPAGPDPDLAPGSYTPKPVYTLAGAGAGAGCTVDEDLYLNYRHLDRCDLQGDAGGVRFQVTELRPNAHRSQHMRFAGRLRRSQALRAADRAPGECCAADRPAGQRQPGWLLHRGSRRTI